MVVACGEPRGCHHAIADHGCCWARRVFSGQDAIGRIALSTAFTTVITMLLASGDPRMRGLLAWISGSTYSVEGSQALTTGLIAVVLIALAPLCRRWLMILPLGSVTARALGMALAPAG